MIMEVEMLIDFKFKNFMSFRNETLFTMEANADKSHEDNLIQDKNKRYSKVRVMYGANASGKSSFIKALDFVYQFVLISNVLLNTNQIGIIPYKFRGDCFNYPSEFCIDFIKNGQRYKYSFSCKRDRVINERLDVFYSAKSTNIFNRYDTEHFEVNKNFINTNKIQEKPDPYKLFLTMIASKQIDAAKQVVEFLLNDLFILRSPDINFNYKFIFDNNDFEGFKKFCLKILENADINITDFDIEVKTLKDLDNVDNFLRLYSEQTKSELLKNTNVFNIRTLHQIKNGDKNEAYELNMKQESLGTQQLFNLAPILYYVFRDGKTLIVDELDKSLHPLLVQYIIKMFLDKDINKKNAQLICNTFDTNLLDLDLLRRDEIWFTEKDFKTGVSELYSLSDFSIRKNENVNIGYMLGRYGAIPFIKGVLDV